MKSEKNSSETGFLANLRRKVRGLVSLSGEEATEAVAAPDEEELANKPIVNKVGKKVFELKVSDVVAVRPALPTGYFYPDAEECAHLHAELLRELPPTHPLFGVPLETFAAREGTDDTLFRFRGNPRRYVLVHLTGLAQTEIDENLIVVFDGTFEEFLQREKTFYNLEPPA